MNAVFMTIEKEVAAICATSFSRTRCFYFYFLVFPKIKYLIEFAPKYRRKVFFCEKRLEIREILRQLCQWKGVEIIEGEVCPDYIHILVSIPPKMSVSGFMGYLKGKSALLIFQKYGNMKLAYRNREFWCKGYYIDTVGKNTKAIKEYIADQLKRDQESDQLAMFDPRDPFMGSK